MSKFSVLLFASVLSSMAACGYINGKGDADKFAEQFIDDNFPGAVATSHQCQSRDTDGNGYVTCSVSVQWDASSPRREVVPLECAVNRAGNGCNNEGCRPLAVFGRSGRQ